MQASSLPTIRRKVLPRNLRALLLTPPLRLERSTRNGMQLKVLVQR